jgi:hypothetical protein
MHCDGMPAPLLCAAPGNAWMAVVFMSAFGDEEARKVQRDTEMLGLM